MIVYDLSCDGGHRFEGWFGSSGDYETQLEGGLVVCPQCGSSEVGKAPMAPSVAAKGNSRSEQPPAHARQLANRPQTPELAKAFRALADAQAKALKHSTWVGSRFTEEARSMHYGETEQAPIHGKATRDQAEELVAEGVTVAPLLFPVAPPDELN